MPQYFFHVRQNGGFVWDKEGSDLADLEAARSEAIENARDAMSRAILEGRDISKTSAVEIRDEANTILLVVPYTEAISAED